MEEPEKLERIVEARLKLKVRFEQQMQATPSVADDQPKGSGPPNRHGMPTIPIGQTKTVKWPVLDLGYHPNIPQERWRLTIDGAVEHPVVLTWKDFMALPQTKDTSDFHCVTTLVQTGYALERREPPRPGSAGAAQTRSDPLTLLWLRYLYHQYCPGRSPETGCVVGAYFRRPAATAETWRPLPHDHPGTVRLERRQMDQAHPVPDGEQAGVLGRAGVFQDGLSLAE